MKELESARDWDEWWLQQQASGDIRQFRDHSIQAPLVPFRGGYSDVVNRNTLLRHIMITSNLRTVLCAGVGVSSEAAALGEMGFQVTALDISPVAIRLLKAYDLNRVKLPPGKQNPQGGSIDYVIGDLMDANVCPGPFDVIVERRTIQRIPERKRDEALTALAGRLNTPGLILSQCNYYEGGVHASEAWFREQGWRIWEVAPEPPVTDQTVWLVRSAA